MSDRRLPPALPTLFFAADEARPEVDGLTATLAHSPGKP
jgi:hypothetical protein